MGVMIKKTGSLKAMKDVKANLKYIGFRSRELENEKKGFFDLKSDNADMNKFIERLNSNKAIKHPNAVKVHKFVYSLSRDEYLHSNRDMKKLIRESMKRLENRNGVKVDWIASFHDSKDNPHVHISMKAISDNEIDGHYKRIYFTKDDFKDLRRDFQMEVNKEMSPDHINDHSSKGLDKTIEFKQELSAFKDMSILLESIAFELKKEAAQIEHEGELERELRKYKD